MLVLAVIVTFAGLLFWAALEKARGLSFFLAALRQLGMPDSLARVTAPLAIALELSVALGLIFQPHSTLTIVGVMVLATTFAFAGLTALRQNQKIQCACFGPYGDGPLGRNQLLALPLWLAGAMLLGLTGEPGAVHLQPASLFALVALGMAALRAISTTRAAHDACADRRSAREMFVWLNR
ncbi:MAG: MauE/DoxX family redox-associated membrane protein [Pseudomonas sp.]